MKKMLKSIIPFFLFICCSLPMIQAQKVAMYSNTMYWLITTPNLGFDIALGKRVSIGFLATYNPFKLPSYLNEDGFAVNPKLIHFTIGPELKYWFCRTFEQQYLGLQGFYGQYNIGGIPITPELKAFRYEGYLAGGGLTYGVHLPIGDRWGLDLSLGLGFAYMQYKKHECFTCGDERGLYQRYYVGPTKLSVSFNYFFK